MNWLRNISIGKKMLFLLLLNIVSLLVIGLDGIYDLYVFADQMSKASTSTSVAAASFGEIRNQLIGVTVIAILITTVFGVMITRMITKPLQQLKSIMAEASQGNLTVKGDYESHDEIGQLNQSFNQMIDGLRGLVVEVKEKVFSLSSSSEELTASAEQTSRASEEIASTIGHIAAGSETQVKTIESGNTVLLEINDTIENITQNAERVNQRAHEASKTAKDGNHSIHTTIEQMDAIIRTMTNLADVIKGLGERSLHIGRIVEVITDIAGQTNLLALNAAIESARAGEHGRGFAVVADEVRKLAEQSNQSAGRIGEYIQLIQAEIQVAVETMETGMNEVQMGSQVVNAAGESFKRIEGTVTEVADQIQYVSQSSQEMASSTRLTDTMRGIAQVAVSNAAATEQAAASAEEQLAIMEEIAASSQALSKMAEELQRVVSKFQV